MAERANPRVLVKILVLGGSFVGKTSIIRQYTEEQFSAERRATIGVDFVSKQIQIREADVIVQLWDTAGQERYMANGLTTGFFRNADGALLVYDVTEPESFRTLLGWREALRRKLSEGEWDDFPVVIVGNKVDARPDRNTLDAPTRPPLPDDDVIAQAAHFCGQTGCGHVLTSAKDGVGVKVAVEAIAALALDAKRARAERRGPAFDKALDLSQISAPQRSGCC